MRDRVFGEIDLENLLPVVGIDILHRGRRPPNTGVVDQNIDAAKLRGRVGHHILDLRTAAGSMCHLLAAVKDTPPVADGHPW